MAVEAIVVFFLDGKQFNPGDLLPDEVAARVGSHCYQGTPDAPAVQADAGGTPSGDAGAPVSTPADGGLLPGANSPTPPVTTGDPASPISGVTQPAPVPSSDAEVASPAADPATPATPGAVVSDPSAAPAQDAPVAAQPSEAAVPAADQSAQPQAPAAPAAPADPGTPGTPAN